MIQIDGVRLTNFMNIESADLRFQQGKGTMIVGENGSGKSAILCAIGLAFDAYKRGAKFEDYIKKDTTVSTIDVDAMVGGSPLEIAIVLDKKSSTALARRMSYLGEDYVNSECDTLLDKLELGYFSKVIFSMQGEGDITRMTPTARASLLSKLLEFDFSSEVDKISEYITELKGKIVENKASIKANQDQVESKEAEKVPVPERTFTDAEMAILQDELIGIADAISAYDKKVEANMAIAEEVAKIRSPLDGLNASQSALDADISSINTSIAAINATKAQYQATKVSLKDSCSSIQGKVDECLEKSAGLEQAEDFANNALAGVNAELSIELENKEDALMTKTRLSTELASLKKDLSFMEQGTCPTCGKDIDQERLPKTKAEIAEVEKALGTIIETEAKIVAAISAVQARVKQAQDALKSATSAKTTNDSALATQRQSLDASEKKLASLTAPKEEHNGKSLSELTSSLESFGTKRDSIADEIEQIKAKATSKEAEKIAVSRDEKVSLKTREAEVSQKIKEFNDQVSAALVARQTNDRLDKEIAACEAKVSELLESIEKLTQESDDNTEAKKVLDKDLPQYLIVKTCDRLEKRINDFLHNVFPDMTIKMYQDKKGVEFFYVPKSAYLGDDKDSWINISMSSGMEKSALSVAWRVALAESYGLDILMLDECDAAATDNSSEKLLTAVLDSSTFSQVFIITHREDTRDALLGSKDIQVYYASNGKFSEDPPEDVE